MPNLLLTDLAIRTLPASDRYLTYWDDLLPAFGVRIGKRSRTFVIMRGPNRQRSTIGRYPAITLQEARKRAVLALQRPHSLYQDPQTAPRGFEAVDQYLQAQIHKLRPRTHHETKRVLDKHFLPAFGNANLDRISTQDLTALVEKHAKHPALANSIHVRIAALFTWCVRRQLISKNPLAGISMPHKVNTRERVLAPSRRAGRSR